MSIRDAAIQYIGWGLCALPAVKAEKRPVCRWKAYQHRLPTELEWTQWRHADAVCIVCGNVSGNLLMIDFDQQGKALSDFDDKIPRELFDRLVIEKSQSGGFHIIVRSEASVAKNTILAKDSNGKVLIETRGEGGLFLCAPTPGYELAQGDFNSIPVLTPDEIETLLVAANCESSFTKPGTFKRCFGNVSGQSSSSSSSISSSGMVVMNSGSSTGSRKNASP